MVEQENSKHEKRTLSYFNRMKKEGKKISFITAYDAQISRIAHESGIDMILVGDSVGNNILGYKSTIPVTMDEMIMVSKAVRRGAPNAFVIGDMPLGSYQASNQDAIYNSLRFIKEAEMDAVKCEGGIRMCNRVKAMADAGIAVMGHIGYTPQSTNFSHIVQARGLEEYIALEKDAESLEQSGAFAILLEAVPNVAGGGIAKRLKIPIYGIGAGRDVDGVLAIVNDVIGLGNFKSKFAMPFGNVELEARTAISLYDKRIKDKETPFPDDTHCYPIKEEEEVAIRSYIKNQ